MKKKKIIVAKNTKLLEKINVKIDNVKDKVINFLEMPKEMLSGYIKVSIIDNNYILLEGNSKIEDYTDTYIKIKTIKYVILLEGRKLDITEMNKDELVIEGQINNISYVKRE